LTQRQSWSKNLLFGKKESKKLLNRLTIEQSIMSKKKKE